MIPDTFVKMKKIGNEKSENESTPHMSHMSHTYESHESYMSHTTKLITDFSIRSRMLDTRSQELLQK